MTEFKVGDYVRFMGVDGYIYGTITRGPDKYTFEPDYYYMHPDDGPSECYGPVHIFSLAAKPQPTDHGAQEYDEIMALQNLAEGK